jgi:RHS repeat-associated protein
VNYTFDVLNRLATVTDLNGTTTYAYDAAGNRSSVTQANDVTTHYTYDSLNRLIELQSQNSSDVVLTRFIYTLDATGRREKIEELSGRVTDYVYDDLYRLTNEQITDAQNGNYSASYQYDLVGNRIYSTIDGVQTAFSYDANDRLTQQGGTAYVYDANGNTLSESEDGITTTYAYDARNKMVSSTSATGTSNYAYNINGIRTGKTEGGVTTNYLVDHNQQYAQVLSEVQGGVTAKTYTYGDDLLSQTLTNTNENSFYLYDGLGSTRALTNSSGNLSDEYAYDAFGQTLSESGNTDNNYLFTGEQFDQTLDKLYLRARYYDQGVGRFTQQDTWMGNNSDPVTLHKYLYANADPVNFVDPTGNFGFGLGDINIGLNGMAQLGGRAVSSSALRTAVNRIITATIKQSGKLATRALKAVRGCIRKKNKCGLSANLLIVGQDNPDMARHISDAQMPHTVVLTYEKKTGGNRQWYRNRSGCRLAAKPLGYQCDEYPFFSTREGGPGKPLVSLRWVPALQNMVVGGHFGFLASRMKRGDEFIVIADLAIPVTIALPLNRKRK